VSPTTQIIAISVSPNYTINASPTSDDCKPLQVRTLREGREADRQQKEMQEREAEKQRAQERERGRGIDRGMDFDR